MPHKVHLVHYLILASILLLGLFLFFAYRWHPGVQFWVITGTVVGYVTWGIVHHRLENRLSAGVIMEYLLVGAVVICLFGLNLLG